VCAHQLLCLCVNLLQSLVVLLLPLLLPVLAAACPCCWLPLEGESCVSQLQELRKLLVEVQGLVSYGSLNTTGGCALRLSPG
jgi:hypothetical protein